MNKLMTKFLDKTTPYLRKAAVRKPELFMVAGTVCVITGTVMCCKATMEVDEIVEEHKKTMDKVRSSLGKELKDGSDYDESKQQMDTVKCYGKTFGRLGRVYAPGIGFMLLGIGFYLGAYKVLKTRNIALLGVCQGLQRKLQDYDRRLAKDYGEDVAYAYRNGLEMEQVKEKVEDENGKKKTVETTKYDPSTMYSPYSRFFDESSKYWRKYADINLLFLKMMQTEANRMLQTRGSVFLNEVYDMLDIPRTPEGAHVGWLKDGEGDGFVDFGIFDGDTPAARRFVNGYENVMLLDFNVDGVIYDKL